MSKVGMQRVGTTNGMKKNRDRLVCGDLRLPTKWLADGKSWCIVTEPYQWNGRKMRKVGMQELGDTNKMSNNEK